MSEIIGKKIIKLDEVDSTNNYATKNIEKYNWSEGTIVLARQQLKGRGQINSSWESEPNKNLLFSIVLYPQVLPAHYQFLISKVIALGVAGVAKKYTDNVFIKWPNDVYIGHKKVAGILIENSIMGMNIGWSVCGIGLNVNQRKFTGGAPNPVSLIHFSEKEIQLDDTLNMLCEEIDGWYRILLAGEIDKIDAAYADRLYRYNEKALYSDNNGTFTGTIAGVNEIGQLLIRKDTGLMATYNFKQVEYL
ncbi:MAG: biotin--[acetyl-CoA-carboxylase] ligase [Prolixibacteraceae bacterium]|nr:biotin--[acetyl-CoA-carboxylase] ligase [Prolixibacteraceae bacterium]